MSSEKNQNNMYSFVEIWARVKNVTSLRTLDDLEDCVDSSKPTIMRKKSKNIFMAEWAFQIAQKFGLSTDWIMTGTGSMRPCKENSVTESQTNEESKRKHQVIEELAMWYNEIVKEDPEREDWFKVELKKAFPEYLEWRKNRETKLEANQE